MAASANTWVTLRTFADQAAEAASAAQGATFVSIGKGNLRKAEVRLRWGSETSALSTGATGPSAVTFALWRELDGKKDKLGTIEATVTSNAVAASETTIFDNVYSAKLYATVESFTGGASPVISGIIEARLIGSEP